MISTTLIDPTKVFVESFPESNFHVDDPNKHAVARVEQVAAEMGLKNVKVIHSGGYDLVIDCIHDMTHPECVISAIRGCINEGLQLTAAGHQPVGYYAPAANLLVDELPQVNLFDIYPLS